VGPFVFEVGLGFEKVSELLVGNGTLVGRAMQDRRSSDRKERSVRRSARQLQKLYEELEVMEADIDSQILMLSVPLQREFLDFGQGSTS
jgi:hypothetical protein